MVRAGENIPTHPSIFFFLLLFFVLCCLLLSSRPVYFSGADCSNHGARKMMMMMMMMRPVLLEKVKSWLFVCFVFVFFFLFLSRNISITRYIVVRLYVDYSAIYLFRFIIFYSPIFYELYSSSRVWRGVRSNELWFAVHIRDAYTHTHTHNSIALARSSSYCCCCFPFFEGYCTDRYVWFRSDPSSDSTPPVLLLLFSCCCCCCCWSLGLVIQLVATFFYGFPLFLYCPQK